MHNDDDAVSTIMIMVMIRIDYYRSVLHCSYPRQCRIFFLLALYLLLPYCFRELLHAAKVHTSVLCLVKNYKYKYQSSLLLQRTFLAKPIA